ncbi:MAG: transporter substrate-binding domain-containing protein, partial [Dolichospermum sp.]
MGVKPWAMIRKLHLVLSATLLLMISLFFLGDNLTVSAATMAEIEQRGYLNLAVKNNLRPLGFRDVKGNLQGLEIDLAKHLASDLLGKVNAVKLQPVANSDRLPVVFNQQVDLAVAGVT